MKKMKRREFIKLGLSAVTIGAIGPTFIYPGCTINMVRFPISLNRYKRRW